MRFKLSRGSEIDIKYTEKRRVQYAVAATRRFWNLIKALKSKCTRTNRLQGGQA